jgi:hypothetical protein
MALPFIDAFTRANAGTLGANWTDAVPGWSVDTNLAMSTGAGTNLAFNNSETYPNDQSAQAVCGTPNAAPDGGPAVGVDNVSGGNGYIFDWQATGSNVQKFVNGSYAGTLFSLSADPVVGDIVKITRVGTTITAYINGVSKGSTTDSTLTGGSPGLWCFAAGMRFDDFVGDSVPPAGGGPVLLPFRTTLGALRM